MQIKYHIYIQKEFRIDLKAINQNIMKWEQMSFDDGRGGSRKSGARQWWIYLYKTRTDRGIDEFSVKYIKTEGVNVDHIFQMPIVRCLLLTDQYRIALRVPS